jgi:copper chaperone CopZ
MTMKTRILSVLALSLTLSFAAAPAASAFCGDDHKEAAKPVPADATLVTLKVAGMHCGDCANAIRNALLKLDGVYDAVVSHESGEAKIQVDAKKVDEAKLSEAIVKAGYKVEKPGKG